MKSRHCWLPLAFAAALLGPGAPACGGPVSDGSEDVAASGVLHMSLDAEGSRGGRYRLRAAELRLTGPTPDTSIVVSSDDYLGEASLEAVLAAGSYTLELLDGWTLERLTESDYEAVEAVLISPALQSVEIHDRAVSRVSFRFRVGALDGSGGAGGTSGEDGEGGEGGSPPVLPEAVSGVVEAGSEITTDTEGDGASPADPVETTIETPVTGTVSIAEGPVTQTPPPGFSFIGQQVLITLPPGASVVNPYLLAFRIDASILPPSVDETNLAVFKDGLPDCAGASETCIPGIRACVLPSAAVPDPCIEDRGTDGGDLVIVVRTSSASDWNFGYALPVDSDGDGTLDGHDGCPEDPQKIAVGACGCGVPESDGDGDGVADCNDGCAQDPAKSDPGVCGCGEPDSDSDGDGTFDCHDGCPDDPRKIEPGICDCGTADDDGDADGTPDCQDGCPSDSAKTVPGACGCGVPDGDGDADGAPDCRDRCPATPSGAVVDSAGCSVAQLCPCARPRGGGTWRSHGSYVACVTRATQALLRTGRLTRIEAVALRRAADRSSCGSRRRGRR